MIYYQIIQRASNLQEVEGYGPIYDTHSARMDLESAVQSLNLDLNALLAADDDSFIHDYFGIRNNIVRDSFPAKDFNFFLPINRFREE